MSRAKRGKIQPFNQSIQNSNDISPDHPDDQGGGFYHGWSGVYGQRDIYRK